ncbi:MAG TPA: hypothetical protein VN812_02845 [Candidatus Acidoferrales bacterium]|nr:hypothetical protein [Candidatus Acidoferrales bacterium]
MPNFRHRLTRTQQRVYDRSNAHASIGLRATPRLRAAVAALPEILLSADRTCVERVSQVIADEIAMVLRVPNVRVVVEETRPSNARGELHGLYTPTNHRAAAIKVWMMTAKRNQVVAFKTFLRTLLHEICHHLDYALLRLPDSLHTEGFYQRESSLFHQIGGPAAAAAATRDRAEPGATAERVMHAAVRPQWPLR